MYYEHQSSHCRLLVCCTDVVLWLKWGEVVINMTVKHSKACTAHRTQRNDTSYTQPPATKRLFSFIWTEMGGKTTAIAVTEGSFYYLLSHSTGTSHRLTSHSTFSSMIQTYHTWRVREQAGQSQISWLWHTSASRRSNKSSKLNEQICGLTMWI